MTATWHTTTLEQVCTRITDGSHWSPASVPAGLPMASVKDLTPFGVDLRGCRLITATDYERLVRNGCQPQRGDVLIAKDGATALDTVCLVREDPEYVLLSSVAILRPDQNSVWPPFLKYYLMEPTIRAYMKSAFTTGAAIPRVVLKDFKRVRVTIPPLGTQRKIATILSAYDDLIEKNNQRIKLLEEMGRRIYHEWFVDFRYPGRDNNRLISSDAGPIPDGWTAAPLWSLAAITMGQSPPSSAYNRIGVGLPFHQGVGSYGAIFPVHSVYSSEGNRIAETGDVLVSVRAPVGRLNLADRRLILGRGLCAVRAGAAPRGYLWQALAHFFREEDVMGGGSIFQSVTKRDIEGLKLPWPGRALAKMFSDIAEPIWDLLRSLTSQDDNLSETRDLLLLRLVPGEVDVTDLKIAMPSDAA
jgi:type I restriction enzyme, S subunit